MSGAFETTLNRAAERALAGRRALSLAQRLEAGEIARFMPCPLPLPDPDTRRFLLEQRSHPTENVGLCPRSGQLTGLLRRSPAAEKRLVGILQSFSDVTLRWLSELLPEYGREWTPQQVTWRSEEEATRPLSRARRSDLLQIDAFASPPTQGARVLRLFVNLHEADARVWAVSDSFSVLLERFRAEIWPALAADGWQGRCRRTLLRWFRPEPPAEKLDYDRFMQALRRRLIQEDDYQEKAVRRLIRFQPGEAWLAFTDGFAHAELRGQFALEHTFLISAHALTRPELAPSNLLRAWQPATLRRVG